MKELAGSQVRGQAVLFFSSQLWEFREIYLVETRSYHLGIVKGNYLYHIIYCERRLSLDLPAINNKFMAPPQCCQCPQDMVVDFPLSEWSERGVCRGVESKREATYNLILEVTPYIFCHMVSVTQTNPSAV